MADNVNVSEIAQGYARAWTGGDVETALTYLADDIVCEAPAGRIEGVEAYRPFTQEFVDVLSKATIVTVLADDTGAAILYSFDTQWITDFRCAEFLTVKNGKIAHITTIFDRLPLSQAQSND